MTPELIPWLAALAFLLGLLALALEIFIVPGFGIAGMLGIILFGWGILLLSVDVTVTLKSAVYAIAISILLLVAGTKLLSRLKFWQRFTLGMRQEKETGYSAPRDELRQYAGSEGVTITPLRPAGSAEVNGARLDVVTEGGYIPAGARVIVVKVEGGRVVVRQLEG